MTEAPRWRLINAHYLNILTLPDGTRIEWEHRETNRDNGRTVRKLYPVPMLLNPNEPGDRNHPGDIIVAHEGDFNDPRDYIFTSDPTPEMEPLNPAAEAITASCRPRWDHPIDTLPVNGGMNSAEMTFMQSMMEQFAKTIGTALPQPGTVVPSAEVADLRERLAKLEALLASQAAVKPDSASARRV